MDLATAITTNGAVRAFRPEVVTDQQVARVLDIARFAPSGGNRQPWTVLVLRDGALRAEIATLARFGFEEYAAHERAGVRAFAPGLDGIWHGPVVDLDAAHTAPTANAFVDALAEAPVLLLVLVDLTMLAIMDNPLGRQSIIGGGSIYPFVQSILLAARTEGLGGVMTTFVARCEPEVRSLCGFPQHVAIASLIALGYPEHQNTKLTRRTVDSFARFDTWDGEPLGW